MQYGELIATITSIIAVFLQAKERIIAWPIAVFSVAILAYIFLENKLYSDFGLHVIYIFLNLYGWYIWSNPQSGQNLVETKNLSRMAKFVIASAVVLGTLLLGYSVEKFTDADLPFFDAFTTSGSLVAQYLLAKKYLENWILWIIVDLVAIPVYVYKELYYIAFLFLVFLVICSWGYIEWKKKMPTYKIT